MHDQEALVLIGYFFDRDTLLQLFDSPSIFSTWLPHRTPPGGHADRHRARSLSLSPFWSFLTCWHFGGRHHEHHADPSLPWWRLDRSTYQRGDTFPDASGFPRFHQ